MRKVLDKIF